MTTFGDQPVQSAKSLFKKAVGYFGRKPDPETGDASIKNVESKLDSWLALLDHSEHVAMNMCRHSAVRLAHRFKGDKSPLVRDVEYAAHITIRTLGAAVGFMEDRRSANYFSSPMPVAVVWGDDDARLKLANDPNLIMGLRDTFRNAALLSQLEQRDRELISTHLVAEWRDQLVVMPRMMPMGAARPCTRFELLPPGLSDEARREECARMIKSLERVPVAQLEPESMHG